MKSINIIKLKNLPNENPDFIKKQKDHFWKSMLFLGLINVFLGLMNIEKYFIARDNPLSSFRKNDHMSVAIAARPYEQIADYFASKNNIDNGYQIIKNGEIVPPKKDFPTTLSYRKNITLGFTDMSNDKGIFMFNYVKNMLGKYYEFILEQNKPDYLMFSFYGNNHSDMKFNESIKIALYDEGYIPSFKEEDYTFGLAHIFYLDRYFRKSTLVEFLEKMKLKNSDFREARQKALNGTKREKFCGAIINNEPHLDHFREKFMAELSKYKKVDNGGTLGNNIGYNVTDRINFLNSYKFTMAFEKNSADGFSTDQILYALLAGTVPIYYGDYLIDEYINPNTYILVRNHIDLMDKIEFIKKVDQDDELYKKFLMEDVLVDEDVVRKRKKDEKDYWNHIFRQDKYDAKRIDTNRFKSRKCMINNTHI